MHINKIKQSDDGIVISYDQHTGNEGIKSTTIRSSDHPRPEFSEAMRDLLPHFIAITECGDDYGNSFIMRSVSFQHNQAGDKSMVMSATRVLKVGTPLNVSTPVRMMSAQDENAATLIDAEALKALQKLEDEAQEYINGTRQQQELPLNEGQET